MDDLRKKQTIQFLQNIYFQFLTLITPIAIKQAERPAASLSTAAVFVFIWCFLMC